MNNSLPFPGIPGGVIGKAPGRERHCFFNINGIRSIAVSHKGGYRGAVNEKGGFKAYDQEYQGDCARFGRGRQPLSLLLPGWCSFLHAFSFWFVLHLQQ